MSVNQSDREQIFNSAADLADAAQRAEYLDQACGDDAQLRVEIEELLRHDVDAGSFLEHPAVDFAPTIAVGDFDTVDDSPSEVSLAFLEPSDKAGCIGTLEHYEVIELVGRGGMGLVLKAFDPKLNRVVAIKVMAPELAANAMAVKRFLREARAAAAVSHDHVVTIHAIHDSHRPPFIVMEFVDGQSLQEKIDQTGGLELEGVLRIGMQTARGLAAAHEQGLVHRDIKPANILLENGVERVKLTDFGLARAVDDVSVTQTGQIAGTPQFMSPEQAEGRPIDSRSDLFSLGSVLYTMCSGRPPFRAETAVAMLRRVTDDTPRPIREVNAEIPDWLEAIIFKLLAKEPDQRLQSAAEVAALLSRHLAHLQHPTTAPLPELVVPPIREASWPPAKPVIRKVTDKPNLSRVWPLIAIGVAAMLAGLAVLGTIIYVATDYGTLVIESEDENVEITIGKVPSDTDKGFEYRIVDKVTGSEVVRLRSGHYRILAFDPNNPATVLEFRLSKEQFVLKRGGKVVVKVTRILERQTPPNAVVSTTRLTEVRRFEGAHSRPVICLAVSSDGRQLLSGSYDATVRLWDIASGSEIRPFLGHTQNVESVSFSPDGRQALSGSNDGTMRLWDIETGQPLKQFDHGGWVRAVAFSPDGGLAVSGSADYQDKANRAVRLWDIETGKQIRQFEGITHAVESLQFSSDGRQVLVAGEYHLVGLWDVETGKMLKQFRSPATHAVSAALSPDGMKILSGHPAQRLENGLFVDPEHSVASLWDVETGREIRRFRGHTATVHGVCFSPDGRLLLTCSGGAHKDDSYFPANDNSIRVWDIDTGEELGRIDVGRAVNSVAFTPDGRSIISGGGERRVGRGDDKPDLRLWRLPERVWGKGENELTEVRRLKGHTKRPMDLLFLADGKHALSCSGDETIRQWNVETGEVVRQFVDDNMHVPSCLALSVDEKILLSGHGDGDVVRIWDFETGRVLHRIDAHQSSVFDVGFIPDTNQIVSAAYDNFVRYWDSTTGEKVGEVGPLDGAACFTVAPDGSVLHGRHDRLQFLNAAERTIERELLGHRGGVSYIAISPSGELAASASQDGPIYVWNMKTGEQLARLEGHTGKVTVVTFTPDGRHVLSGGWDRTLRVWDVATHQEVARATTKHRVSLELAVSPDGRSVLAGGGEWWDNDNKKWVAEGDYYLRLWRLPDSVWPKVKSERSEITEVRRFEGHKDNIDTLAFSPDGRFLFVGCAEKLLYQWDVAAGSVVRKIPVGDYPTGLAVLPDGEHVITSHFEGGITMWSLANGRAVRQFAGHTKSVRSVRVSPDGKRLLSAGYDGLARLWNVETAAPIHSFSESFCDGAAMSDDGRIAVHGATGGGFRLWETASGQTLHQIKRGTAAITTAAFSPSGEYLVTGDGYGLIQVWNVNTGKEIHHLDVHREKVTCLVFTPDGRYFITGSYDQTLRLFDMSSGQEVGKVESKTLCVSYLAISPDGSTLASGGGVQQRQIDGVWQPRKDGDYAIHLWRLPESVMQPEIATHSLGMKFSLIPTGEFVMGTAAEDVEAIKATENWFFADFVPGRREAETPQHRVSISKPFEMSRHEVTVGQFRQFVQATGYKTTAEQEREGYGWRNGDWQEDAAFDWRNPGFEQTDDHPVCNVSWDAAVEFCRWLSEQEGVTYRLPTEAEWEYACRAETTTLFSTGDDPNSLQGAANLADATLRREQPGIAWAVDWEDGFAATAPVGSFTPNAFGLYDMHGNVWEWCQDVYDDAWYETSPVTDPHRRGSRRTHIFRGGGFDNWPGFLRSSDRYSSHSDLLRTEWAGFRVVREVIEEKQQPTN